MSQSTHLQSIDLFTAANTTDCFATGSGTLLTYTTMLGANAAITLADTGASRNILNTAVPPLPPGARASQHSASITTATGTATARAQTIPKLQCVVAGHQTTVANVLCVHLPGLKFGLVLGVPFFQHTSPTIDWPARALRPPTPAQTWQPANTTDELAPPI